MQFKRLTTIKLDLHPQLQWLWHSDRTRSFIVGDERKAFALPVSNPAAASALKAARDYEERVPPRHPCNLPMPTPLHDELANESWHGFRFLECAAYDRALDDAGQGVGDLLRTLVFGPDYGLYVLHPFSGLILSLRARSLELLQRTSDGFKLIEQTRTRGRSALAFAAHPEEGLIVYGDNFGSFHGHRFDASGFGKATKIATKERKASRLEFVRGGRELIIGGMGYLTRFSYADGKFALLHEEPVAVRDFVWVVEGEIAVVNQGMHGVTAYRCDQNGIMKVGGIEAEGAVNQIAVSKCGGYLAVTLQESASVGVYAISPLEVLKMPHAEA